MLLPEKEDAVINSINTTANSEEIETTNPKILKESNEERNIYLNKEMKKHVDGQK